MACRRGLWVFGFIAHGVLDGGQTSHCQEVQCDDSIWDWVQL